MKFARKMAESWMVTILTIFLIAFLVKIGAAVFVDPKEYAIPLAMLSVCIALMVRFWADIFFKTEKTNDWNDDFLNYS